MILLTRLLPWSRDKALSHGDGKSTPSCSKGTIQRRPLAWDVPDISMALPCISRHVSVIASHSSCWIISSHRQMGHSRLCVIQLHGGMVSVKKGGLRVLQVEASTDSSGPVRGLKADCCKDQDALGQHSQPKK